MLIVCILRTESAKLLVRNKEILLQGGKYGDKTR